MDTVKIKVIGVGGAGNNAVHFLAENNFPDTHFVAVNTDAKSLDSTSVDEKLMIGHALTRGLSAGGDVSIAKKAAESDTEKLEAILQDANIVFIVTGLGGGTGTGAAPYIAQLAKKQNSLVISFATLPFNIEGANRYQTAETGLANLRKASHATISLPNDLLLQNLPPEATVIEAFNLVNTWIERGISSIIDILHKPGIINLDFSALKNTFENKGGKTLFGLAQASGSDYIKDALNELILCPLLHTPQSSQTADSLLVNIIGGRDLSLQDVNQIGAFLSQHFNSKKNTLIGAVIDDDLEQSVQITVIGITDISRGSSRKKVRARSSYDPNQQVLFEDNHLALKSQLTLDPTQLDDPDNRGYFFETERALYNGQDLDIPTYLRQGIKINL